MAAPARFPNGVTNVSKNNPLGQFGMPDPSKWHLYFNDFDHYVVTTQWTETKVGTGTVAVTDIDGGGLLITNSAADNDAVNVQKIGESFLLAAGKRAVFKARFKVSDATDSDLFIGLAITDTVLLSATAGDGVTDGVFFQKDDGSTSLIAYCQKDTTTGQTSLTAATLANDTFVSVGWAYNGVDSVEVYVNDVQVGTLAATSATLPDTELTVSFALINGAAAAKNMTIDYILAAVER